MNDQWLANTDHRDAEKYQFNRDASPRVDSVTQEEGAVIGIAESKQIAAELNDGIAAGEKDVAAKLGITIGENQHLGSDFSKTIANLAKDGLSQEDLSNIRAMAMEDKDGIDGADNIRNNSNGQQVSLDDISVPTVNSGQGADSQVQR